MPRQPLFRSSTLTGSLLLTAVMSSWRFIWNDPSPDTSMTSLLG